jgi:DNA-binding transcriptional LysR family regulator
MKRSAIESLAGIDMFVQVARARSFSAAAAAAGMTPSGVSRAITRLEARLGVRLLQRTTRAVSLTDEGVAFYERCAVALADLREAAEAVASVRASPRGRLRVDAAMVAAELAIGPALPRFLAAHPEITLEMSIRDQPVDPVRERIDLLVRMGGGAAQGWVSRRLGSFRVVTAASPDYLRRSGRPRAPADLRRHSCMSFLLDGAPVRWTFAGPRGPITLEVSGRMHAASGLVLRRAALDGMGIVHLYEPFLADDLASGALVPVLEEHEFTHAPIFVIYPDRRLPARARVFVDFLAGLFGGARAA